ncbi:hypothetical protein GUJ93_ZPchr0226g7141 [Zizania palustris]|uniref:FRIGIDA-like protein n=1 Tax=Zizania palustris TaxID=103762 RepID=A0A8J5RF48_ZIZPA|nr:hypothetical protein GUJ93_ZPchr0226g7141 [Zizania palustris]
MAPPPASASASAPFSAMILAVLGVTVYSDALNDFLHKWDSLLSRADSISARHVLAGPPPLRHHPFGGPIVASSHAPGRAAACPDPAELVFRAIHRYYIRYIRAKSTHAEAACDLLLESYVSAGCPLRSGQEVGNDELRAEAREEVLSWRTLLVRRAGRVAHAAAKDARGLLLLMAAFGVPVEFPAQEIYELLHSSGCLALAKDAFPDAVLANCITGVESVGCRKDQDNEDQYKFKGSRKNDEQKLDHLISIPEYVDDHKQCFPGIFFFQYLW